MNIRSVIWSFTDNKHPGKHARADGGSEENTERRGGNVSANHCDPWSIDGRSICLPTTRCRSMHLCTIFIFALSCVRVITRPEGVHWAVCAVFVCVNGRTQGLDLGVNARSE